MHLRAAQSFAVDLLTSGALDQRSAEAHKDVQPTIRITSESVGKYAPPAALSDDRGDLELSDTSA
ncbi:MAG: hypothetical protein IPJ07_10870 [Acidobacteria bacterium]|nr:hypothetical protein [Acidobacteriota bacterium]